MQMAKARFSVVAVVALAVAHGCGPSLGPRKPNCGTPGVVKCGDASCTGIAQVCCLVGTRDTGTSVKGPVCRQNTSSCSPGAVTDFRYLECDDGTDCGPDRQCCYFWNKGGSGQFCTDDCSSNPARATTREHIVNDCRD